MSTRTDVASSSAIEVWSNEMRTDLFTYDNNLFTRTFSRLEQFHFSVKYFYQIGVHYSSDRLFDADIEETMHELFFSNKRSRSKTS